MDAEVVDDTVPRLFRGGAFDVATGYLRSAHRTGDSPKNASWDWGFRIGRTIGNSMSAFSSHPPHVSVIFFAFLVMTKSSSPGSESIPAWLVTPEIVTSPPAFANGLVLLRIRVTEFVDGSYDGVKLTTFCVVTVFFFTRFFTVE